MNTNDITRQLIKARAAERAMRDVLEQVEGIGLGAEQENELLRSKVQISQRVTELEAQQADRIGSLDEGIALAVKAHAEATSAEDRALVMRHVAMLEDERARLAALRPGEPGL